MFRKGSLVLLAGLVVCAMAGSAWADNNSDAKTAFPLTRTGVDARALGMGGAYTALANDASASYWNPAGLYMMGDGATSLTAMYTTGLAADRFQNYLAVGHRFTSTALGFSWQNTGIRDVAGFDQNNVFTNTFGDFENVLIGSLAVGGGDRAAFGVSVKGYLQKLNDQQRNGLGFDAGVQFKATDALTLGAVAQDMGGKVGADDNRLPFTVRAGVGIRPMEHFNLGFDVAKTENVQDVAFRGGAEFGVKFADDAMAFLRGGMNDTEFSAGLGVQVSRVGADYAFTNERDPSLGNAHRVSLRFNF